MDFLKTVAGKVISGLVAVAVIAAGIAFWRMDPSDRHALTSGAGKVVGWFLVVLVIPWITFSLIRYIAKFDSNLAGGLLVSAYTLAEAIVLIWLFNWRLSGATAWTFLIAGALIAGLYNLLTCDWIAEKVS